VPLRPSRRACRKSGAVCCLNWDIGEVVVKRVSLLEHEVFLTGHAIGTDLLSNKFP
jgi:hypothetical protein